MTHKFLLSRILLAALLMLTRYAPSRAQALAESEVVIRVDDLQIDASEFEAIFRAAMRHKFYHGRIPDAELIEFRERVVQDIVTQVIVHREAERLGLQPDREAIARDIEAFDAKYASDPTWQQRRERVLAQLERRMERQSLLEKMEARVRQIPRPDADQVRAYYQANPDKFTEPEQLHSSVILLRVAPSANEETWLQTEVRARELRARIDAGEDFAALARNYSEHHSAADGGDLGYLHRGILEKKVQERVDALDDGAVSDPIRVLEGVILFKLQDRRQPQLRPFDEVQQRAADLLYRNLQEQAWNDYITELKASADIYVNENLYVRSNHE